jgi:hypothetical protein
MKIMRSRNIKPGFFKNEELADIHGPWGRLLFAGLWCLADREGRLEDRPRRIKAEILPYDEKMPPVDEIVNALEEKGFIHRYAVDNQKLIQINKFSIHQKPHNTERQSLFPAMGEITVNLPLINGESTVRERPDSLIDRFTDRSKEDSLIEGKGSSPIPGGNGDACPAFSCQSFEISQDHMADITRDYPQFPTEYLLTEFFPRMKAWCLDHQDDPKHLKKFDASGRLKNPRSCFLNWLKTEDPGKAAGYRPRKTKTASIDPPGFATVFSPDCPACRGSGRDGGGPCACGKLEPLLKPEPHCQLCGGGGLSKTGPCSCLHQV